MKLTREEICYIRDCIQTDIAYRKEKNYMPEVDDRLELMGISIVNKIYKLLNDINKYDQKIF